jgi:hypothetical protein
MPALLYYDPSGARFSPIQPDEFAQLLADLSASNQVSKLVHVGNSGSCTAQGVDFSWTYDGVINLQVSITAKHGFITSHVPNATIFDHLNSQFIAVATQAAEKVNP